MTNGIIYNNELADYFTMHSYGGNRPPVVANAPGPGRRPLSSTCPSIITNKDGDVVMVVGASGGTRITLSTAWVRNISLHSFYISESLIITDILST